ITDATNTRNEIFGRERLTSALGQVSNSPGAVLAGLETGLAEFVGDAPQFDDITLLAVRRSP
ncbi:MAG TPA: SpoIIE family protein phosphatase, partial [Anaerolineales bacterium]|nr:SpoIIE family protein phosphatase [Anaerolineales bacterium]